MLRYMYITSLVLIAINTDYFPKNCGQRYSRTGISASTSVFFLNVIPPIIHTHLYLNLYQKDKRACYGKLQTDLCSFACQEAVDRKLRVSELEDRKPNQWRQTFFFSGSTTLVDLGLLIVQVTRLLRHTILCRTSVDGWSARRRDLYLTTHNTH
jgi:hypothetical protein